jgi:hypothetical protein
MYIAHECTKCRKSDIIYNFSDTFSCRGCGHTENEKEFWEAHRSEMYLRDLEIEIEERFPFKDMDMIDNTIDLAIGWHVLGKYDGREQCIETVLINIKELHDKWQICYCNFGKVERRMIKYEKIGTEEDRSKYQIHLDSMRDFFKHFPEKMKNACK